jgi:mRNA-degrading endonuclease toxin of MazEF toxin-antitoxin module
LHEKARRLFAVEGEEREDPAIVYLVDLNPAKGREQAGPRYVIIVSPREFNRLGTPRVCPTTQGGNFGLL